MVELSIVVPIYNVEKYLSQCIDSLLKLENINYELILVNDGSTDGSEEIINKYLMANPGIIKYIKQENAGLSAARNAGLKKATGNYIIFIDSDDYVIPKQLMKFWDNTIKSKADVAIANYEKDIEGVIKKHRFTFSKKISTYKKDISGRQYLCYMYDYLRDGFDCEAVTQIYSISFLRENHLCFLEGIIHEDTLFAFEVLSKAKKVVVFDIPFYRYRMRSGSIMHTIDKRHYDSIAIILDNLLELRKKEKYRLISVDSYIISLIYELSKYQDKRLMEKYIKYLKECTKLTVKAMVKKLLLIKGEKAQRSPQ